MPHSVKNLTEEAANANNKADPCVFFEAASNQSKEIDLLVSFGSIIM